MMNDSFNIVIDSDKSYEGTANDVLKYYFDFSIMGQDIWEMRFCFRSELGTTVSPAEDSAIISIPEFNYVNHFRVGPETISAPNSKVIGFTKYDVLDGKSYSHANYNDNPCVLVNQPSSQIFTVNIDNVQAQANTSALGYMMILNFKKCSCDKYK